MTRVPPELTQARADELISYARLTDRLGGLAQHPRVTVVSLGRTTGGREIPLVAVGQPAAVNDLDGTCRRAAAYYQPHVRSQTWDDGQPGIAALPLPADVRLPVLIEGGTFGFEASHTEGLLLAIERLATDHGAEVQRLLDHTVALFVPMANPDGRERSIHQWRRFPLSAGQDGSGNAYGFTVNRDFFHLATPESAALLRAVTTYAPVACLDTHEDMFLLGVEYGEVCFCPPYARGHNAESDPEITKTADRLGSAIARHWHEAGFRPLYREDGAHGFLAPPRPEDRGAKVSTLAGLDGRLELALQLHGIPTLITESARTPGTQTWEDRNGQKCHAALAVLSAVAEEPETFVRVAREARLRAVHEGRGRGYAVPLHGQPADALAELVRILLGHGLHVYQTTGPEAAYVIPQAQPAGRLIRALLSERISKQAALGPCLGLRVLDLGEAPPKVRDAFRRAPLTPLVLPPAPTDVTSAPGRGRPRVWTVEFSRDGIAAVNRVLARRLGSVRRIVRRPDAGAFALEATPLDAAQATQGLHVGITAHRRGPAGPALSLPRTALYAGQGVNERPKPYLAGVRHALDRLGFPYSMLEEPDIAAHVAEFEVLVVPGGNARDIVRGWPATGIGRAAPWQSAGKARGIGPRGLSAIRAFVRRGGTYVGIGAGGGLLAGPEFLELIDFDVVAATLGVGRVWLRFPDPAHPLARGYPGHSGAAGLGPTGLVPAMYYSEPFAQLPGGPVFRPGRQVTAVALYAGADATPEESNLINREVFDERHGHAAILHQRIGRGHVCVFGIEPAFRGTWWRTAGLLANALYLAGEDGRPSRAR